MSLLCRLGIHRWGYTRRVQLPENWDGVMWAKRCNDCKRVEVWSQELLIRH